MTPTSEPAPTAALAEGLAARRAAIVAGWRAAVDADPELTTPTGPPRQEFANHLPDMLDDFERRLRIGPSSPAQTNGQTAGAGHDRPRWRQGYDLREVILEWGHFQCAVLRALESCREEIDPASGPAALAAAQVELARVVNENIADHAEQFARLQARDAAERVRDLERTLAEFHAASRRRVESWREASHELRGQLNIIVSATALLDDPTLPEPMREESFAMLKKGVRSIHKMLAELLDAAHQEAGREGRRVEPFDAGALLGNLCAAAQPLARERGLRLIAEGPKELLVEGDRGKVQRIAQNLLLNALRYTERGEVTLRWSGDDAESWSFQVRDTGPGLPVAAQAIALERDESSRSRGAFPGRPAPPPPSPVPGEGIGLSIVRHLGKLLDAHFKIEAVPGEGTNFHVVLPRHYREEAEVDAEQR